MSRRTRLFLLTIILLGAGVSRLVGIESQSLWIDEGFTWNLTQYHDPLRILQQDVHPPLYFVMVDAWVALTGTSMLAMRYFSLLPSLVSIAVVYQLAREVAVQRRIDPNGIVPVLAALLLALADAEYYLAQEMRSYTWHVLWVCLSMWGFLRWLRTSGRRWLVLWVLSTIALVYTFYLGAFIGVVQGLYTLFAPLSQNRYINRKRVITLGALVVCALALLPWLLLTLPEQSGNLSYAEWIRLADFRFWAVDFVTRYFTQQWALMIGLLLLGGVILRYRQGVLHPRWRPFAPVALLLLWLIVPLLLTILINEQIPLYQPRRVTQIVPAIALLTAFGLANFPRSARYFLISVVIVYGVVSVDFWRYKQPWHQMAADTAEYMAPGVPLLFELGGDDYAPRYHYGQQINPSHDYILSDRRTVLPDATTLIGLTTWRHLEPEAYANNLPPLIDSLDHLWLFYWSNDEGALFWLDEFGFRRTATLTVDFNPDVYLYRYDRVPDTPRITYTNEMQLADVLLHGDTGLVDLLWQTSQPLDHDWTTSVTLTNDTGEIIAQQDSPPLNTSTSRWKPQQLVYDPKILHPVEGQNAIPAGTYDVYIVVYRVGADGNIIRLETMEGDNRIRLGQMTIRDEN